MSLVAHISHEFRETRAVQRNSPRLKFVVPRLVPRRQDRRDSGEDEQRDQRERAVSWRRQNVRTCSDAVLATLHVQRLGHVMLLRMRSFVGITSSGKGGRGSRRCNTRRLTLTRLGSHFAT